MRPASAFFAGIVRSPAQAFVLAGLVVGWLFLVVPLGTARWDKPAPGDVTVKVVAILASEGTESIDPRVECIAKEVQKLHPNLTRFRPGKTTCKPVAPKGTDSFDLVCDQQASVTVLKGADKENRVQLKITPPTLGEITYTTTCGKFFPIVTRYQTANKEWLIIAVCVEPCNGKKK